MIRSVAVFCGSKSGNHPQYENDAKQLGILLAKAGIQIVYGAGNKGIMGCVANAALEHNGKVVGVIPRILVEWEVQHTGLTDIIITETMHQRKKLMYELSDAAIVLPGGYGTMDEFFEMLTWNQLSIHNKKIFLLNTLGFFNPLEVYLQKMEAEGFLYNNIEPRISFCTTPDEIVSNFAQINWHPNHLENDLLKLTPLHKDDFEKLYAVAADPLIWEQHPSNDRYKKEVFQLFFDSAIESKSAFLIIDKAGGNIIGSTRFYDYKPENSSIALGFTFLAKKYWGGRYNQACKKLLLDYAFQFVDKVYFHVGVTNTRSQIAILKTGAVKVNEVDFNQYEAMPLNFEYVIHKETWLSSLKHI